MNFNFFGAPFSNAVAHAQRLRKIIALPILSSDALSSVAYGTEQILRALAIAGAVGLALSLNIAGAICILLALLGVSYYQTIQAYPNGGGAFLVAKENLGAWPGVFAGAALLIDYLLTVAVSIAAGILAITSAIPALMPHTVLLCVIAIMLIAWMNLRGVRESATLFAYPIYIFIAIIFILLIMGLWKIHAHPNAISQNFMVHEKNPLLETQTGAAISLYLILNAFSQGCSALTGIECISNAVPTFKAPEVSNARKTLLTMISLLGVMFFGITYLANLVHVVPTASESLLSQLGHFVFYNGVLYYVLQIFTAAILLLAANTGFTGFPRLASILSHHQFLPKQFSSLGDHLSFSNGILSLAIGSCVLIILFQGNVDRLIPLYSVGVFLAFSLSQLGMVRFWFKKRLPNWPLKACINAIGGLATFTAFLVIVESKFFEGAWITIFLLILAPILFFKVHRHYQAVENELSCTAQQANAYLHTMASIKPKVILPVSIMHRGTLAALNLARVISNDVTAVIVDVDTTKTQQLKMLWQQLDTQIPLVVLPSPYRETIAPLKHFIQQQDRREPERGLCMIIMSQAVPAKWWHYLLHNQRAMLLKASLILNLKNKGFSRVFVDVPYQL